MGNETVSLIHLCKIDLRYRYRLHKSLANKIRNIYQNIGYCRNMQNKKWILHPTTIHLQYCIIQTNLFAINKILIEASILLSISLLCIFISHIFWHFIFIFDLKTTMHTIHYYTPLLFSFNIVIITTINGNKKYIKKYDLYLQ